MEYGKQDSQEIWRDLQERIYSIEDYLSDREEIYESNE